MTTQTDKSFLIGDIGSTKSSWHLSGDEHRHISLQGFNPLVHSPEKGDEMVKNLSKQVGAQHPGSIWYYGAGVVELKYTELVRDLLVKFFPNSRIHVSTDLEGAARAACGTEKGTIGILGTGSHAAVYDGQFIFRQANTLGYILGDEGGGCDIGKSLIQAYFYNQMPEIIRIEMQKILPQGRSQFLKELYSSPAPNQFLAALAKVAVGFHDHPWIVQLVGERFHLFVKRHLVPLSPIGPVHIVGSIGSIFTRLIEKEITQQGLKTGLFIRDPSYRLFEMHLNHDFN